MANYENEFSNFPVQKITKHNFKNVDDSIADVIDQINSLRAQGSYDQAENIIQNNIDILSHYIVDAVTFRTRKAEIYNTYKKVIKITYDIYLG